MTEEIICYPSNKLRYVEKYPWRVNKTSEKELVLQQLYTSNIGTEEWRDIKIEK